MDYYVMKKLHFIKIDENKYLMFDCDDLNIYEIDKEDYIIINAVAGGDEEGNGINSSDLQVDTNVFEELINNKILVKKELYSKTLSGIATITNKISLRHITLNIANDCNLRCKYCFGDGGTYNHVKSMMSYDTAQKSIDYFVRNSGSNKKLHITFFGGEPLLNYILIEKIIAYCKELEQKYDKKFSYSAGKHDLYSGNHKPFESNTTKNTSNLLKFRRTACQ